MNIAVNAVWLWTSDISFEMCCGSIFDKPIGIATTCIIYHLVALPIFLYPQAMKSQLFFCFSNSYFFILNFFRFDKIRTKYLSPSFSSKLKKKLYKTHIGHDSQLTKFNHSTAKYSLPPTWCHSSVLYIFVFQCLFKIY